MTAQISLQSGFDWMNELKELRDCLAQTANALRQLNDEAVRYYGAGWTTDELLKRTQPIIAALDAAGYGEERRG